MKKLAVTILTLAILCVSVGSKVAVANAMEIEDNKPSPAPLPTHYATPTTALVTEDKGAICAMANVLSWEILQTYLYAITGQQAYSVYAENEENQQSLYADFVDFCENANYGVQVNFEVGTVLAGTTAVSFKEVMNYYKTAGSSALAEMQEQAKAQMKLIYGGKNNDNPTPTPLYLGNGKSTLTLMGLGSMTKQMGKYIKELVNGNRGEISETFKGNAEIFDLHFDGEYKFDERGFPVFDIFADCYISAKYLKDSVYLKKNDSVRKWSFRNSSYSYEDYKIALLVGASTTRKYDTDSEIVPMNKISFYVSTGNNYSAGNFFYYNLNNVWTGNGNLEIETACLKNIAYVPVFTNYEDIKLFFDTGDYSKAINAFSGETVKPSNWLNYDFGQIADKLDSILKALTTLPQITTESLAGFAQGVANGIVAGNVPAAEPATQQQQMEKLLEETAKETAISTLAGAVGGNTGDGEYSDEKPRPTRTPEEVEKEDTAKKGTIMVDLHKFFPFCVPYDLVRLIGVFKAEPQAPCFEGAIKYDELNINVPIKIDLSPYDNVASVFRLCEKVLFILGLIVVTRSLIRG